MKKLIPDYYAKDIFSIPISFYKENGIKYIFSDLDNTLDACNVYVPCERVIELAKRYEAEGLKLYVLSNNNYGRVSKYANGLGVKFLYHSGKPSGKKISNFMKEQNVNINEAIMIGDQLLTDVLAAKRVGVKVCLTDRIAKVDQWCTHFNRFIDNILRKKMKKKGQLNKITGGE